MRRRKYKVLLIEDNPTLNTIVKDFLSLPIYDVKLCRDYDESIKIFRNFKLDACIIDLSLSKHDFHTLAKELKTIKSDIPFLYLTNNNTDKESELNNLYLYKKNVDAFLSKPFSLKSISDKTQALIKKYINKERLGEDKKPIIYKFSDMTFNYTDMFLKGNGTETPLTKKECELMKYFLEHKNRVVTREETLMKVWGTDSYFIGRSMDVFITKLRKHLKTDPKVHIANIHGIGFKFEVSE